MPLVKFFRIRPVPPLKVVWYRSYSRLKIKILTKFYLPKNFDRLYLTRFQSDFKSDYVVFLLFSRRIFWHFQKNNRKFFRKITLKNHFSLTPSGGGGRPPPAPYITPPSLNSLDRYSRHSYLASRGGGPKQKFCEKHTSRHWTGKHVGIILRTSHDESRTRWNVEYTNW